MSRKNTATERTYESIRLAILSSEFAVGDRLTEIRISEMLGVSRTPIRAALQRLHAEGFVELHNHTGAVVKGWSRRDAEETFIIRAHLESLACSLAARNATVEDVRILEGLCHEMEAVVSSAPPVPAASEINQKFHAHLLKMSGNRKLEQLCLNLMEMGFLVRSFSTFSQLEVQRSLQHHRDIVRAIAAGNHEWASALMKAHILAAADVFKGTENASVDATNRTSAL